MNDRDTLMDVTAVVDWLAAHNRPLTRRAVTKAMKAERLPGRLCSGRYVTTIGQLRDHFHMDDAPTAVASNVTFLHSMKRRSA